MRVVLPLLSVLLLLPSAHAADLVWVTTDFTTGGLARQHAGSCAATEASLVVPGDPAVRSWDRYVFVIGRLGYDNVTILDADNLSAVLGQYSIGNGSNPQDLLVRDHGWALVSRFDSPNLLVLNPLTGETLGTVDLSPFADGDGNPEATLLARVGDRILVVCQRLDRGTPWMDPAGPGCVVVLDAEGGGIVDVDPSTPDPDPFWLPAANPTGAALVGGNLYLTCTGTWSDAEDGALVWLDPLTGEATVVVREAVLGGNVCGIAVDRGSAFLVVSYPDWTNGVVPYDLGTGHVGAPLQGVSGGYIPHVLAWDGVLYVADQGTWAQPELAGVVLFDTRTTQKVCGPVSVGLPPMGGCVIASTGATLPEIEHLIRVWPNPTTHEVSLAVPQGWAVREATLWDLAGHRVLCRTLREGETTILLRDARGNPLPSGSYVLTVVGEGSSASCLLVVE